MKGLRCLAGLLLLVTLAADADERVSVCFNYGCAAQAEVVFSDAQLQSLAALIDLAPDAAAERVAVAVAVGRLLQIAGTQSPIRADRGGNIADDGVSGKMDCIDHSTTTTRLLQMIERLGWLRFHRVGEIVLRHRFLLFDHYSAQLLETGIDAENDETAGRYVIDSWFFNNGQPAAVMPLAIWLAGAYPDDDE